MPPPIKRKGPSTAFVEATVWFAAAVKPDLDNKRAQSLLRNIERPITTDHVLLETWTLLNSLHGYEAAERFVEGIRQCGVKIEPVLAQDLTAAFMIAEALPDDQFSLGDRTCFAVMQRLNLHFVASFDPAFREYRYGRNRDRSFDVLDGVQHGNASARAKRPTSPA